MEMVRLGRLPELFAKERGMALPPPARNDLGFPGERESLKAS